MTDRYTKIINGEISIHAGWKRCPAEHAKRCSVFPTVWGAILGCTGEPSRLFKYTVGNFGRRISEYACPTCKAYKDHFDSLNHPDRQDALIYAQKAAGVADYRTAKVKRVKGVPKIVTE